MLFNQFLPWGVIAGHTHLLPTRVIICTTLMYIFLTVIGHECHITDFISGLGLPKNIRLSTIFCCHFLRKTTCLWNICIRRLLSDYMQPEFYSSNKKKQLYCLDPERPSHVR